MIRIRIGRNGCARKNGKISYKKKCIRCKEFFLVVEGCLGRVLCDNCSKKSGYNRVDVDEFS